MGLPKYNIYISHTAKKVIAVREDVYFKNTTRIIGLQVVFHKKLKHQDTIHFLKEQTKELEYIGELYTSNENGDALLKDVFTPIVIEPKKSFFNKVKSWLKK